MIPCRSPKGVNDLALALVKASTVPALLLDKDLQVVAASISFCSVFHIDPSTIDRRPFAEVGEGEWNVPQLSDLLKATASGFAAIANCEMNLVRKGQPNRLLVVNAQKLEHVNDIWLYLSISDVTAARRGEFLTARLLQEREILFQELHHRLGNSLQIIASVLLQRARKVNSEEARSHLHDAHQRIMSIAALQRLLANSNSGDVELRPYFSALCDSIGASMIQNRDQLSLEVTVDDSITAADISVSLGLIVTELVINSLKHAFPGNRGGRILVDYRCHGPNWTLSVKDDGVGIASSPGIAKAGLGTSIVEALARQLGAEIIVTNAHPGTEVSIAHSAATILVARAAI
jgi:two-component sensor histidine kinase